MRRLSRDYTPEARRHFAEFAERYGLSYPEEPSPIEVLWRFPAQAGLVQPIVLGLQNSDELNFGVGDFWSYFLPFDEASTRFDAILDAWMIGDARVARYAFGWGLALQVRQGQAWKEVYQANFGWGRLTEVVRNASV